MAGIARLDVRDAIAHNEHMKSAVLLPVFRLQPAIRSFAVAALTVLLPVVAEANRPHHHISPRGRKIIAANSLRVVEPTYTGSSSASFSFGAGSFEASYVSGGTLSLSASGDLVKTGAGTLALGGTLNLSTGGAVNTYTGATTVNAGTLNLSGSGVTTGTSVGGITSTVNGSNAVAFTGTGAGILTMNGTAVTTITNGTLNTNTGSTGTAAGTLVINGGTLGTTTLSTAFGAPAMNAPGTLSGVSPVPEPSSTVLALLGAGLLSQRRQRR